MLTIWQERKVKKTIYQEQNKDGCATSYVCSKNESVLYKKVWSNLCTQPVMPEGRWH